MSDTNLQQSIKLGFDKIEFDKCKFYQDGRDFLRFAAVEALKLHKQKSSDSVKHKIALITSYTGLNFLLLSILQASIPNLNQRKHVIYNRQLVVKNNKLTVNESSKTIETHELIKRLNSCNYNIKDIEPKLREIAEIRNNVIHHFNNRPEDELMNHIVSIFLIINEIISDKKEFWGESWEDLIRISNISDSLKKICKKSYKQNKFTPSFYFNCLHCSSDLLNIRSQLGNKIIKCETCQFEYNKNILIQLLSDSSSYRDTHKIICMLEVFSDELYQDDLEAIEASTENPQVGDIIFDDDIRDFFIQLFGEEYFD